MNSGETNLKYKMNSAGMVLQTKGLITASGNSRGLKLNIPSWMATDSQFPFKAGDPVTIVVKKSHIDVYPGHVDKKSNLE